MNVHRIVRTLGLLLVLPVIVLAAGCADTDAPTWESEELAVGEVSASRIVVSWPAAEGASAYVVRIDGEPAARLGPEARTYAADELEQASEHAITVHALDEAGNESTVLSASATTLDATAPSFPADAALELTAEAPAEPDGEPIATPAVVLRWPAATDNVAVTRYRVLRGDDELAAVDAPATSARIETTSVEVRFEVRALDAAGNETAPGLAGTYRAPAEDARLEVERARAQVEQMLLGALGPSDGTFADVLADGADMGNTADILAEADGVGIAGNSGTRGEHGGGGLGGLRDPPGQGLGALGSSDPPAQIVRGRATLGALQEAGGTGTFDIVLVQRMLRVRLRAMQRCYERELRNTPELTATVRVRFTIEPTGSITSAHAVESVAPVLDPCVVDVVRRLRFNPGPEGGPAIYETSVAFAPQ